MTLHYLRAIAEFCDRKFEFKPGTNFEFRLDDIRKQLALTDRVRGGTGEFCSFLYWQLKQNGFTSCIWWVEDFKEKFFVVQVNEFFVSYYDGKIYLSDECPWKPLKYTLNLKEWCDARDINDSPVYNFKLSRCDNYA